MRLEKFRKKYFKEVNGMKKERKEEFGIKRKTNNYSRRNHNI